MTTVEERREPKAGYKVVGSRPIRHDGVDKVTGRAQYGADINLPGTLQYSPYIYTLYTIQLPNRSCLPFLFI